MSYWWNIICLPLNNNHTFVHNNGEPLWFIEIVVIQKTKKRKVFSLLVFLVPNTTKYTCIVKVHSLPGKWHAISSQLFLVVCWGVNRTTMLIRKARAICRRFFPDKFTLLLVLLLVSINYILLVSALWAKMRKKVHFGWAKAIINVFLIFSSGGSPRETAGVKK